MRDGPHSGGGPNQQAGRSLLDRVGPAPPVRRFDEVQARIDSITGAGPGMDPAMLMAMQQGGFHPGMMQPQPGMDMGNPLALQEMMMNQMALMAQMATSMGILNPATGQFGGFPQGMGGPGFDGGMGPQGTGRGGRGGRGRGGPPGRGRGGHANGGGHGSNGEPTPAPSPPVVAPTPVSAAAATPSSQARPGFVPPERPQSPTLCKYNLKCTNPTCRYSHPSPVATPESGVVLSNDPCEKGIKCADADCIKGHVSPAVKNGGPIGKLNNQFPAVRPTLTAHLVQPQNTSNPPARRPPRPRPAVTVPPARARATAAPSRTRGRPPRRPHRQAGTTSRRRVVSAPAARARRARFSTRRTASCPGLSSAGSTGQRR